MVGLNLFTWLLSLFNRRLSERSDDLRVRREVLAHQRRQLIHQAIPDVDTIREAYGASFEELLQLLTEYSPYMAGQTSEALYYPELTRTIIYKLSRTRTEKQLRELLAQELNLWFGLKFEREELEEPDELDKLAEMVVAIQQWRRGTGL